MLRRLVLTIVWWHIVSIHIYYPTINHSSFPNCSRGCASTSKLSTSLVLRTNRRQTGRLSATIRPWSQDGVIIFRTIKMAGTNTCNHWPRRTIRKSTGQQIPPHSALFYYNNLSRCQQLYQWRNYHLKLTTKFRPVQYDFIYSHAWRLWNETLTSRWKPHRTVANATSTRMSEQCRHSM